MADADEALGQDVKEPATDEFVESERFALERVVSAVAVAQDDASRGIEAFEAILVEGGLFDISREVSQCGAPTPGVLALSDPIDLPYESGDAGKEFGVMGGEEETEGVAGGAGEGFVGNEIILITGMVKEGSGLTKSHGGNQGVKVGMEEHAPSPGVEDADEGWLAAQIFERGAEGFESGSLGCEEGGIKFGRKEEESGAEFSGNGDGEQIIRDGQKACLLPAAPERGVTPAAARTRAVVAAVVKEMAAAAGGAMVQAAAASRRAATENGLDGRPGARRDGTFGGVHKSAPVLAQDLREVQRDLVFELVIQKAFLDLASAAFADLGDMEIDEGRVQVGVAEIGADLADGDAVFEQVGGEGMPQSVAGGVLFDAAGRQAHAQGILDGGHTHGVARLAHGEGKRARALLPAAADAGKEPVRVAVEAPVLAKLLEHDGADGNLAHLAALAVDDAQDAAGGVKVGGLDGEGLADAQAAMIDE